jgi:hypothetical protein
MTAPQFKNPPLQANGETLKVINLYVQIMVDLGYENSPLRRYRKRLKISIYRR